MKNDRHPGRVAARMLLVAVLIDAACATTPAPTPSAPSSPIAIIVTFVPIGDGTSFSARLNGQDFTHGGASTIDLTSGTYQIAGSFVGAGLTVSFQTLGHSGGVVAGSTRSLAGPVSQVASCAITYAGSAAFQVEFQVAADAARACAGAAP